MQTRLWGLLALAVVAGPALADEKHIDAPSAPTAVSPTVLRKGTPCTVKLFRVSTPASDGQTDHVSTTYKGEVAEVTETTLTLKVTEKSERLNRDGARSNLPLVGHRLFSSNGIRREKMNPNEATVAIPVKTIESITLSPGSVPTGTPCRVQTITVSKPAPGGQTDERMTTYQGKVAELSETFLTLKVSETFETLHRTRAGSNLPLVGPLFTTNSIQLEKTKPGEAKVVLIPVKTIESITLVVNGRPPADHAAP